MSDFSYTTRKRKRCCAVCEEVFSFTHENTLTCSEECRNKRKKEISKRNTNKKKKVYYKKVQQAEKQCIICGTSFMTSNIKKICCDKSCSKINNDNTKKIAYDKKREEAGAKTMTKPYGSNQVKKGVSKEFLERGKVSYYGYTEL